MATVWRQKQTIEKKNIPKKREMDTFTFILAMKLQSLHNYIVSPSLGSGSVIKWFSFEMEDEKKMGGPLFFSSSGYILCHLLRGLSPLDLGLWPPLLDSQQPSLGK
ncbi:hypothetical protein JTE90_000520 [Oedothorax gibbosus]|uniref:Uncharacterized protein n=1 Tax=Oedothorax gibbosus TaxID=931172 RepID=A0AAV6VV86_9ARAC|nr:hypothetical protein JTE90_000520 [Oedothorax gibbosus]